MTDRAPSRVLFLAPGFSEPGGCASHARKIAEGLAGRGCEVRVIARLGSGRRLNVHRSGTLTVVEVPGFHRRWLGALLFLAVAGPAALLQRRGTTYLAMQLAATSLIASTAGRVRRAPAVLLATSTGPDGEAAVITRSRLGGLRRTVLGWASVVVGQTETAAGELRLLLPDTRVAVVPTPVTVPGGDFPLDGRPRAAYSGRLVEGKGLDELLLAWESLVSGRIPEAELVLVGSGWPGEPTEDRLLATIGSSPRLQRSVRITGWVDDVADHLRRADVYVFCSASEGMSNAMLEAVALGRVVVASDIPANVAVLGEDHPLLVDPRDIGALAATLEVAFTDAAVREAARSRALERIRMFDLPHVLGEIEALLTQAAR